MRTWVGFFFVPIAVLVGSLIVGCGPASLGEELTMEAMCKPALDGKRVSVSGYFSAEGLLTMCTTRGSSKTCGFDLQKSLSSPKPEIGITLSMGDDESQIAPLPKPFKSSDIHIKTVGGKVLGDHAHIRVTGKALVGAACQIVDVDRIDAL